MKILKKTLLGTFVIIFGFILSVAEEWAANEFDKSELSKAIKNEAYVATISIFCSHETDNETKAEAHPAYLEIASKICR